MTPIQPISDKKKIETASTSGAIQNPMQQMQQNFNFFGSSSGLDSGSVNANGQKPSATTGSSGPGQSANSINSSPNGKYTRIGQSTGIQDQPGSSSATAYQRQGAGGSLFGAGFSDASGGNDAFIKMKKDAGGQFA